MTLDEAIRLGLPNFGFTVVPNPKPSSRGSRTDIWAGVSHTTEYMTDGSVRSYTTISARQRPDGVWEMPE